MTDTLRRSGRYIFLTIAAVLSVFPLYFMLVSATNTSQDVLASKLLPGTHLMDNITNLLASQDVASAFWHSTVNAVVTTVLALIISSIAGYGFEVYHSKAKDRFMWLLLLTIMIPFAATMIPLFQVFAKLGMINSTFAVVLPAIATPFLVLMFRQTARSFPHEIIEAARMDGIGELAIFFRMFIPTMRPAYVAATVITFLAAWNNFLWPKVILLNNEYQTMPMLISNLLSGYVTDYGALMLAVFIASVPTIILFLVLQRAFVAGFTGAVK